MSESIPSGSKTSCLDCSKTDKNPVASHTLCRKHRLCFRTEGYFPDECIVCQNLQLLWKDGHLLNLVKIWKTELKTTQKNRPKGWSYGQTFTKESKMAL